MDYRETFMQHSHLDSIGIQLTAIHSAALCHLACHIHRWGRLGTCGQSRSTSPLRSFCRSAWAVQLQRKAFRPCKSCHFSSICCDLCMCALAHDSRFQEGARDLVEGFEEEGLLLELQRKAEGVEKLRLGVDSTWAHLIQERVLALWVNAEHLLK